MATVEPAPAQQVPPAVVEPAPSTQEPTGAAPGFVPGPAAVDVPELPPVRHRPIPAPGVALSRRRRGRRRLLLVAAMLTGGGIAGTYYAFTAGNDSKGADRASIAAPSSSPTPTATNSAGQGGGEIGAETGEPTPTVSPSLHSSGVVEALHDKDGIDLDNNRTWAENVDGVDISFYGLTNHIGAMENAIGHVVQYAVLPGQVKEKYGECVRAAGWTRRYHDVHSLQAGRAICVKADEGHLAMMVVEKPANPNSETIGFRYYTWE